MLRRRVSCSGVRLEKVLQSHIGPARKNNHTTAWLLLMTAKCRTVLPERCSAVTLTPAFRSGRTTLSRPFLRCKCSGSFHRSLYDHSCGHDQGRRNSATYCRRRFSLHVQYILRRRLAGHGLALPSGDRAPADPSACQCAVNQC